MSDAERAEMLRLAEVGGLDAETAPLVIDLAATLAGEYGATEDYLVTREFKGALDHGGAGAAPALLLPRHGGR